MWKWFLGVFVLLVLLCAGGGFFVFGTPQGRELTQRFRPGSKPTEVRIEPASRGDLVRVVSAPGNIEPKTRVQVGAQVSAKVIALPFREGDEVKVGDVIVRLDADDYVASLESAKAALRADEARLAGLRAELANTRLEFERVSRLYETKDVSKADFDQAQARMLSQEASVRAAEHNVEVGRATVARAEKNLEFTTIRSGIDGTLVKLNVEVGEQVLGTFNNIGTVIAEIADLSTMIMKARVDEANIAPVRVGQPAKIYMNAYPDKVFDGAVDLVGLKRLTERDGTSYFETQILVKLDKGQTIPQGDRIRSGYTANADIQVETSPGVLRVPSQAVVDRRIDELPRAATDNNPNVDRSKVFTRVVYVVGEDGKTRPVPVTIGNSDVIYTTIVSGLNEGERVVTGPFKVLNTLRHDQSVVEEGSLKRGEGGASVKSASDTKTPAAGSAGDGKTKAAPSRG